LKSKRHRIPSGGNGDVRSLVVRSGIRGGVADCHAPGTGDVVGRIPQVVGPGQQRPVLPRGSPGSQP